MSDAGMRQISNRHDALRKSLYRNSLAVLIVGGMLLLGSNLAFAQSKSLFGSSGTTSRTGTVGGAAAGGAFGSSSSGFGSAFGGSSTSGAFGSRAPGTFGSGTGFTGQGQTGAGQGSGLVGRRANTGRLVGQAQSTNQTGGMGRGQGGQFGSSSRGFGATGMNGQGANAMGAESAAPGAARLLHPQQRLGFAFRAPTSDAVSKKLTERMEKLTKRPTLRGATGVTFAIDGSTVTLKGEVDSEETKRLVGMLAGLEPGVGKVHNELTINSSLPGPPSVGAQK